MNKTIMEKAGFSKEVDLVEKGICPFCNCSIDINTFRDESSLKEYYISGLCQDCQDETFK